MKKIIFLIPVLFISCIKKDIKSIVINNNQSTELNLFEGKYTVHFMSKKEANYNFSISDKEITDIKNTYHNLDISSYDDEVLVTDSTQPIIMPVSYNVYIINFSDGTKQTFKINMDLKKNPLEIKKFSQLKIFIDKLNAIIKSKKEIINAPKSDFKYI